MEKDYANQFDSIISSKEEERESEKGKFSELRQSYKRGKKESLAYIHSQTNIAVAMGYASNRLKKAENLEDIYSALGVYEKFGRYNPSVKSQVINKIKTFDKSVLHGTNAENRLIKIRRFLNEEKMSDLEHIANNKSKKILPIIALVGLIGGLFFLSPNLTGNLILNATKTTSNWIGIILSCLGLIALFVSNRYN